MSATHDIKNAARARPLHLLVVDDNTEDIDLCLHELRKSALAFDAQVASTREDFVSKLKAHPVDVVVADYRMKGWTGMDAFVEIKSLGLDIPLILFTGTLGDELAVECIKLGATDYVLKEQLARLPVAIQRAHEEKELRSAEMLAVEALRQSEARYRSLVENATYGIYRVTFDGDILHVNPALVQMLGYESEQEFLRIGKIQSVYVDPAVRQKLVEEFLKKPRVDAMVEWKRKDGKLMTVRLNGRRVRESDRVTDCIEVIVEDVTERRSLEKQLLQAQKFEAIGQLAGGIAHDFNNMIGAIIGWADLGMEEAEPESRLRRHFEKMRHQADRAAALTRQLLAFSRRQILEPRNIDLNQTVTEVVSLLEKVIGGNIAVKVALAPDVPVVHADATQVEQVLMNLCINARDAMPQGGTLTIETSNVVVDEKYCALQPFARSGHYAMLSVTDSGTGMDAATLDRIFEPFFTTKEPGKGTGLGLATVYGIVRQHAGFVNVYSEPNAGTRFRVYLPVSPRDVVVPDRAEDSRPVRGGSEAILVAEDHEGLREIARETLASFGYQVLLAADGEQALSEFYEQRDRISLVLLDVMLPKLSGPEVYARISEKKPGIPVIFASGYSPDFAMLRKVQELGLPTLQKPYSARDLARKVREILDQSARLTPPDRR